MSKDLTGISFFHEQFTEFLASFKNTFHFFSVLPICRAFSQKSVKYFWGHMKDTGFLLIYLP